MYPSESIASAYHCFISCLHPKNEKVAKDLVTEFLLPGSLHIIETVCQGFMSPQDTVYLWGHEAPQVAPMCNQLFQPRQNFTRSCTDFCRHPNLYRHLMSPSRCYRNVKDGTGCVDGVMSKDCHHMAKVPFCGVCLSLFLGYALHLINSGHAIVPRVYSTKYHHKEFGIRRQLLEGLLVFCN